MVVSDTVAPTFDVDTNTADYTTNLAVGDTYTVGTIDNIVDETATTNAIVGDGDVDNTTPGSYTVTYTVTDSGSPANSTTITETVVVADEAAPVITLTGDNPATHEAGATYTDAGATVTDNVDTGLTATVGGDTVDATTALGTYTITYDAQDAAGNDATQVSREVVVVDTTAPVIALTGDNPFTLEAGVDFVDPGSTVTDFETLSATVGGDTVDNGALGTYTITYDVSDSTGNNATQVSREVVVVDTTAPTFDVDGNTVDFITNIPVNGTYTVGTIDNILDGTATTSTITGDGDVVTSVPGASYTVTYTVEDAATNSTTITETVNIGGDTDAPGITSGTTGTDLAENSGANQTVYTATATDNIGVVGYTLGGDDADKLSVTTAGVVTLDADPDFETQSSYSFTITAQDAAGNNSAAVTVTFSINNVVETVEVGTGEDVTYNSDLNDNVNITGGGTVTLADGVTINGDITISEGSSLLAPNGSITGTVTYIRTVPTTNWYLISSPVAGETVTNFMSNAPALATGGTHASVGGESNIGLSNYDNTTGAWSYYPTNYAGADAFTSGEGKAIKLVAANGDISFSGSFNDADASIAVSTNTNGFNLIGNPYLASVSVSDMVTANNALLTEQTVWLWDQAADAYVQKNLATDLEVVPGQGFFVSANAAGNFSITEAMQSHTCYQILSKEQLTQDQRYR